MPKSIKAISIKSKSTSPTSGHFIFSEKLPATRLSCFHHINHTILWFIYNDFHIKPMAFKWIRNGISKPFHVKKAKGMDNPHREDSLVEDPEKKTYMLVCLHQQIGNCMKYVGIDLKLQRFRGKQNQRSAHGGEVNDNLLPIKLFTRKVIISAALASLNNLTESKAAWVEESIENLVIRNRARRLSIKWILVEIPPMGTHLVFRKKPATVSDKGSDKGHFVCHVETFVQQDSGQRYVGCFHPKKTMTATKGNKIDTQYPGPDTFASKTEVKEYIKRASFTMGDPATHAGTEEMREFGKDRLSQAE